MYACMHEGMYISVYVCMHVCVYACMYACTHIIAGLCMCVCTRAVRRRHCVGLGSPVNISRRRRTAGPKKSATARPGVGGQKHFFSKIHEKNSFYPQNFLRNFLVIKALRFADDQC